MKCAQCHATFTGNVTLDAFGRTYCPTCTPIYGPIVDDLAEPIVRLAVKHALQHNAPKGDCETCDAARAYALAKVSR